MVKNRDNRDRDSDKEREISQDTSFTALTKRSQNAMA